MSPVTVALMALGVGRTVTLRLHARLPTPIGHRRSRRRVPGATVLTRGATPSGASGDTRSAERIGVVAGALAGLFLVAPLLGFTLGLVGWAVVVWRSAVAWRAGAAAAEADVILLGRLTSLGLSAGLSFAESLRLGAAHVAPRLRAEAEHVLRRAALDGSSAALGTVGGMASGLYTAVARAATTGAPVGAAVESFIAERARDDRGAALERARRLPVRLLFPLALLILPGFLLLTIGPAVLGALERLQM